MDRPLIIQTARLELVAAAPEPARAMARNDRDALARLLGATVTPAWPPPIMADALDAIAGQIESAPGDIGWGMWFVLLRDPRTLIGTVGLKGPPVDGRADVGYAVLDVFQCRGYATEATAALIDWTFADPRVDRIIAETLPELTPSIRVMDKCGMVFVGVGVGHEGEPAVQQYQLIREHWAARQSMR